MALTGRDMRVLDVERSWWQAPGTKAQTIRDRLGLSPSRYYELLAVLADSADARAYDPLVVHRLRRTRALRRRSRFGSRAVDRRSSR